MNKANTPFRYDYVGSFLRPAGLKQARADFQNGKIGADELKATEDQATVDPKTGITLSEVMQEAVDQEVALADLEAGESITFDMPMMLASGETGTK